MEGFKNKKSIIAVALIVFVVIIFAVAVIVNRKKSETGSKKETPAVEVQKDAFDSLSQPVDTGKPPSTEIIDMLPEPKIENIKINPENPEDKSPSTEIIDLLPAPVE